MFCITRSLRRDRATSRGATQQRSLRSETRVAHFMRLHYTLDIEHRERRLTQRAVAILESDEALADRKFAEGSERPPPAGDSGARPGGPAMCPANVRTVRRRTAPPAKATHSRGFGRRKLASSQIDVLVRS